MVEEYGDPRFLLRALSARTWYPSDACICSLLVALVSWNLYVPNMMTVSPYPPVSPPPSPFMSTCAATPSLQTGWSSPMVAPLALLHTSLPCCFFSVPPSLRPPHRLTPLVSRSLSRLSLPNSYVITFSLGICSAHIPGQVAVYIPVAMDDTHRNVEELLFYVHCNLIINTLYLNKLVETDIPT